MTTIYYNVIKGNFDIKTNVSPTPIHFDEIFNFLSQHGQ
jgi:hypothetical protein